MRRCRKPSNRVPGFSFFELSLLIGLISLVLIGLLGMLSSVDDSPYPDVTPYRWANALYAQSQLEKFRTSILAYYDQTGALPGDFPHGNGNSIIEKNLGEDAWVLRDLFNAGVLPDTTFLIRGREPDLYHTVLWGDGRRLGEGHFIKLVGFDRMEALALDRKYDDARSDSGNIIFPNSKDDHVDLFVKLVLY